jgi:hypothetical protein
MEPVYQFQHTHLKLPKIRLELTNPLGYHQPKAAEVCKIITANYLSSLCIKFNACSILY